MKNLSDADINEMINHEFISDKNVQKEVRSELHLSNIKEKLMKVHAPEHIILDLHQYTEEQAWGAIKSIISMEARSALIITGASGILKIKFQQWAKDSIISDKIESFKPMNNGSFLVKFKRVKTLPLS